MFATLALVLAVAVAQPQSGATTSNSPLIGVWAEQGGSTRARIAPCAGGNGLCATVVGTGQTVLTGLAPNGAGRWRGRYVGDGMNLAATVRLNGQDTAAMTACRLVICQTVTYRRVR